MSESVSFSVPLPPRGLRRNSLYKSQHGQARLKDEYSEAIWCAVNKWESQRMYRFGPVMRLVMRAPVTTYAGTSQYTGEIHFWPMEWAHVHYAWHSIQRTDPDNIIASMKVALDTLTTKGRRPLGIIKDDAGATVSAEWVKAAKKADERVEITITRGAADEIKEVLGG